MKRISIEIDGVTYASLTEASKITGHKMSTLKRWSENGVPTNIPNTEGIQVTVNNKTYVSLYALAKDYKIKYVTVWKRYSRGIRGGGLVKDSRYKKLNMFVIKGVGYSNLKQAAKELNTTEATIRTRLWREERRLKKIQDAYKK